MATNTRKLAALLGSSGANITDAGTINTAGITNDAINADKIVANAVGTSEVADNVLTATDLAANSVGESELSVDYTAQSVPHIIPGVLYPAYNDKKLDGTALAASTTGPAGSTVTSSKYGTVQSDGKMYYYTSIRGSKPIKDPRIGAHFGSQRHTFRSLQILEEETAAHGEDIFTIDGREWIRAVGGTNASVVPYDDSGHRIRVYGFVEIVGYFIDVNLSIGCHTNDREFNTTVDDGSASSANTLFQTTQGTPLAQSRYVSSGSLGNLGLGLSLGIHTLKVTPQAQSENIEFFGVELIAQDTSSTANKSKIQIPAQNVVSAGKKFAISATAEHYDPFSAKTDGSAWTSPTSGTNNANSAASWPTNIDTANSLGLDKWVDGSNYYRPYNGGRVVKYVDSTGTIKTAVTVMPPNAKSIKDVDINKKAKNAGNTSVQPTFELHAASANEDELHEVAKTFHFAEIGNGGANHTTSWRDVSTISTSNQGGFCMDDGTTALCGDNLIVNTSHGVYSNDDSSSNYRIWITFIGTGITIDSSANGRNTWAQNLHYGTHTMEWSPGNNHHSSAFVKLDGVTLKDNFTNSGNNYIYNWGIGGATGDLTFHQPKMPPIPDDAVVLADYMLMADFVPVSSQTVGIISKGVREQNLARDVFYEIGNSTWAGNGLGRTSDTTNHNGFYCAGHSGTPSSGTNTFLRIPSFGTNIVHRGHASPSKTQLYIGSTSQTTTDDSTNNGYGSYQYIATDKELGVHNFQANGNAVQYALNTTGFEIVTPIHTSYHYQPFETPFLHELVGGDRNMEQTNLVCSPDGKTWDEVTRDTSYIGKSNTSISRTNDTVSASSAIWIFDECRGQFEGKYFHNKDWAISYDKMWCLVDGDYQINWHHHMSSAHCDLIIRNDAGTHQHVCRMHSFTQSGSAVNGGQSFAFSYNFKRGDYLQLKGGYSYNTQGEDVRYHNFQIVRL